MTNRVERTAVLNIYEVNGEDTFKSSNVMPKLAMKSHWNSDDRVVISVGDNCFTVIVADLKTAISSCSRDY